MECPGEVEAVRVVVAVWVPVGGVLGEWGRFTRGDGAAAELDVFERVAGERVGGGRSGTRRESSSTVGGGR